MSEEEVFFLKNFRIVQFKKNYQKNRLISFAEFSPKRKLSSFARSHFGT